MTEFVALSSLFALGVVVGAAGAAVVILPIKERHERAAHEQEIDRLLPALAAVRPAGVMVVTRRRSARIAAARRRLVAGFDWVRAEVSGLWRRAAAVRLRVVVVTRATPVRRPVAELDRNQPGFPINPPTAIARVPISDLFDPAVDDITTFMRDLNTRLRAVDAPPVWPGDAEVTGVIPRIPAEDGAR